MALVHGVTGSGKTEVYLRLADVVRKRGRGVLVLVPEIALTPQVAALFRARFGAAVAIQHSGLSDGERHDQWHRIRRGDVDVVIGTRSAVFAPLANPGLIIVDEEHDTSYKQDETPRYHGRDVAIMRGKFADALVVLGSATPTIESYANALDGRYTLVSMHKRVLDRPLASVTVVNMRDEIAHAGDDVVLSRPLAGRDRATARARGAVVDSAEPPRACDLGGLPSMHGDARLPELQHHPQPHARRTARAASDGGWNARCHYCNFSEAGSEDCEKCAAPYMERIGFGTERVEAEMRQAVPGCAHRSRRSRHRAAQGQSRRDARQGREPRDRHPDRHADDRQGPRLSGRARSSA